jgi:hypothetical protein
VEIVITKVVHNYTFFLHEFLWIFSQLLAILFDLFSFRSVFNSKIILQRSTTCQSPSPAPGRTLQSPVSTWRHASHHALPGRHGAVHSRLKGHPTTPSPLSEAALPPRCQSASRPRVSERRCLTVRARLAPVPLRSSTDMAVAPPPSPCRRNAAFFSEADHRPSPPSPPSV